MLELENKSYASTGEPGTCRPFFIGHYQRAKKKVEPLVTAAFTDFEPTDSISDLIAVTTSAGLPPLFKIDPGIFVKMIPWLDFVGSRVLGILRDDDDESRRSLINPGDRTFFPTESSGTPGSTFSPFRRAPFGWLTQFR